MILAEKWWIPKMYNLSRSTTFILVISSSDKVIVNIVHNQHVSHIVHETMSDMWICEQCLLILYQMKKWPK